MRATRGSDRTVVHAGAQWVDGRWESRGSGLPLRDRPTNVPGVVERPARRAVRHCWVAGPAGAPGRWPGVIIEWRRDPLLANWSALVVYVVTEGTQSTTVHTWVSADFLSPATGI